MPAADPESPGISARFRRLPLSHRGCRPRWLDPSSQLSKSKRGPQRCDPFRAAPPRRTPAAGRRFPCRSKGGGGSTRRSPPLLPYPVGCDHQTQLFRQCRRRDGRVSSHELRDGGTSFTQLFAQPFTQPFLTGFVACRDPWEELSGSLDLGRIGAERYTFGIGGRNCTEMSRGNRGLPEVARLRAMDVAPSPYTNGLTMLTPS